jgi:hypothetical protein
MWPDCVWLQSVSHNAQSGACGPNPQCMSEGCSQRSPIHAALGMSCTLFKSLQCLRASATHSLHSVCILLKALGTLLSAACALPCLCCCFGSRCFALLTHSVAVWCLQAQVCGLFTCRIPLQSHHCALSVWGQEQFRNLIDVNACDLVRLLMILQCVVSSTERKLELGL